MTRHKKHRLYFILGTLVCVTFSAVVMLTFFKESLVFFYTPSELSSKTAAQLAKPFRLGGLVMKGTVHYQVHHQTPTVTFDVSDGVEVQRVVYTGILPDLFREGQGIVAEGTLGRASKITTEEVPLFYATTVLAKHDENYTPPELEKGLKRAQGLNQASHQALEKSLKSS